MRTTYKWRIFEQDVPRKNPIHANARVRFASTVHELLTILETSRAVHIRVQYVLWR